MTADEQRNYPVEKQLILPVDSNIDGSILPLCPERATLTAPKNDLIISSSVIKPSTESAHNSVMSIADQYSTVGTQTSDVGTLTASSGGQRFANPEQENSNGLETANNVSAGNATILTNENLTIGLEKYRMSLSGCEQMEESISGCNDVGCQTISKETIKAAHVGGVPFKASRIGRLKGAMSLEEVDGLKQKIAELEEKLLATETTVVWQSIMIKCLNCEV